MELALALLATSGALASALALYLASPNRAWQPGAGRPGLRMTGGGLALVSLGLWIALSGVGAGLCVMLATWMLAMVALPYLAWWTADSRSMATRPQRTDASSRTLLETD